MSDVQKTANYSFPGIIHISEKVKTVITHIATLTEAKLIEPRSEKTGLWVSDQV